MIGQQQFLLGQRNQGLSSEVEIYLKARNAAGLDSVVAITTDWLSAFNKNVVFRFDEADNIFNVIFPESEAPLEVRLRATTDFGPDFNDKLAEVHKRVSHAAQPHAVDPIVWQNHTVLKTSAEKLLLYDVPYQNLYYKLRSSFNENNIFMISDNTDFLPVVLGGQPRRIEEIIAQSGVRNNKGQMIPVRELVDRETGFGLKTLVAGKEGEYYPVPFRVKPREAEPLMQKVKGALNNQSGFEASFAGSIFSNREMVGKLALILLISLALLYFILASQFESLTLPFLVLLEVPVDLFGAFLFLKLFGGTINLMSMIGMIVMSGIVINDSILKVDTINRLRAEGLSLMRALSVAGRRRLKPILMTSLTTILALLPILFTSGFGSDLQRPLALAIIGGMTVGTVISLFFIPLGYYYLKRSKNNK
jgi:multidrug efflux pump subunit AcrB